MPWIAFKERKPQINQYVIIRDGGSRRGDNCIHGPDRYIPEMLKYSIPPTHWWEGDQIIDEAEKEWFKPNSSVDS